MKSCNSRLKTAFSNLSTLYAMVKYTIIIEKATDGGYGAYVSSCRGSIRLQICVWFFGQSLCDINLTAKLSMKPASDLSNFSKCKTSL